MIASDGQRERWVGAEPAAARLRTTRASRILDADAAAARLLGRSPAMLVGKPLAVFVGLEDRPGFRSRLALLSADAPVEEWELSLLGPHGEALPVAASVQIARRRASARGGDVDDEVAWTVVPRSAQSDGLVEAPAEPAPAEAGALERALAELAHDLKQPLAVITSYARGAILRSRAGTLSPADLEAVLEVVVAEAARMAERLRRDTNQGGSTQ